MWWSENERSGIISTFLIIPDTLLGNVAVALIILILLFIFSTLWLYLPVFSVKVL